MKVKMMKKERIFVQSFSELNDINTKGLKFLKRKEIRF